MPSARGRFEHLATGGTIFRCATPCERRMRDQGRPTVSAAAEHEVEHSFGQDRRRRSWRSSATQRSLLGEVLGRSVLAGRYCGRRLSRPASSRVFHARSNRRPPTGVAADHAWYGRPYCPPRRHQQATLRSGRNSGNSRLWPNFIGDDAGEGLPHSSLSRRANLPLRARWRSQFFTAPPIAPPAWWRTRV